MNEKKRYKTDVPNPTYLYEVDVDVEVRGKIKTRRLVPGTLFTVHSRTNLPRGNYSFLYAEDVGGTLLIYADWRGHRKTVRESDVR